MKYAIGVSWVLLGASGMGVSEAVAFEAFGVALRLRRLLTLRRFEKRKRAGRRMGMSWRITETTTEVASLESPAARSLLRYLSEPLVTAVALLMEFLIKVKSCSSSSGKMWVGIE